MLSLVPANDCLRARESISARLDGELSELGAARLRAHLRACPDCAAYASGLGAVTGLLRDAALEVPAVSIALPTRRRLPGLRVAAAAAAAVAIAATSSFVLGRALGAGGSPAAETTASVGSPADLLGLRSDSLEQHLAMLWLGPRGTPNYGRVLPL